MCGIAALFAYGQSAPLVDRDELMAIRDQMAPRGPDGAGAWFSEDGRIALGHRRLSIIDLSEAGAQPMFNLDRSLGIVFNGEIYNYRELRTELLGKGYRFESNCDTEVLLHLYAEKGAAMMNDLRGMYAFAIWDQRKQGMLLARDPFGIKPLYYADDGQTFRIASQVKALRAGGKIDLAPDPAGHVGFFLWGNVPDPYTFYRNIRSLPAGSTMWVDRSGPKAPKVFRNISSILAEAEQGAQMGSTKVGRSESADAERTNCDLLRAALRDTVRAHLVADVPVGVFLSSGLDSTTIAAMAAEQGGNLRTVTLGFEEYRGTEADETPLAEQFAHRCGATHQTVWVSRADFEAERDDLFKSMDRPSIDGVNTYFVSLAARRAGLKVALSGVGGDELFGTYPSFREIPRSVRFFKPFAHCRSFGSAVRYLSAPVLKRMTSPKYAGMFEYAGSYGGAYLLRRGMFMPWELPDLLDPEMVREGWTELQSLLRLDETTAEINSPRLKVSALEMQWYMRHQLLRDSDWAGMGHSLEIRVPLVDVEFVRQIAPSLTGPEAPSKRDMAAAASELMTPEILDRRKTGFEVPVRDWLSERNRRDEFDLTRRQQRGLRGWALEIYSQFPSDGISARRRRYRSSSRQSERPARAVLMLLSDAFGGFGGIAKFNRDFLTALCSSPHLHEVIAVPRVASQEQGDLPEKLTYVNSALGGKFNFMRSAARAVNGLRAKTSKVTAPPIIICGHINLLPAAVAAKHILGGAIYLIIHGYEAWKPTPNRLANACVRQIDDFISVSAVTRRRFLRWTGLRQDMGMILPNCVDLAHFTPGRKSEDLLERYHLRGRKVLMTLGRLAKEERYKGFDEMLEILPSLAREVAEVSYLIVGDGPDRSRLEKKAFDLGIADRVVFAGRISEEEKVDHYRLADVYVMPSSGEGFGIVYLEALACGISAIGSKADGSRDALLSGKLGTLVNPRSPSEIEEAVLRGLQERQNGGSRSDSNGAESVDYFSKTRFDERVHSLMDALMD